MDLKNSHPSIDDLRRTAKRRTPRFAWEYLDSGTGADCAVDRNRTALDRVLFRQKVLIGKLAPDLGVELLGQRYDLPFGMAPVGSTGLIWPEAELMLARLAATRNIPYTLSTVALREPEEVGPLAKGRGWFQLYTPGKDRVRRDLLRRAKEAGFSVLVLTADVPLSSRRERQRRAGLSVPPRMTPGMILQMLARPAWTWRTLRTEMPRFKTLEPYIPGKRLADVTRRMAEDLHSQPDWGMIDALREDWDGPLVIKGIMRAEDAVTARSRGVDAVWVSNHGGRQLDAARPAIAVLPEVRAALGPEFPVLFDSGVRSGLDIARALALGADFVMLGRAFLYGAGAFGETGVGHAADILTEDLINAMGQIGANGFEDLRNAVYFETDSP